MMPENVQFGRKDARYYFWNGFVPHSYRSPLNPSDSYECEALKWQRRGLKTRTGVEALALVGGVLAASYYLPFILPDVNASVTNTPPPPGVISPISTDTSQPIIASPASLPTLAPIPESTVIFDPTPEPTFEAIPTSQSEVLPDRFSLDQDGNILHEGKSIPPPPLAGIYQNFRIGSTLINGKLMVRANFQVSDQEITPDSGLYPTESDYYDPDHGCWWMSAVCGDEAQFGGGQRDYPAKIPDYTYFFQSPKQLKDVSGSTLNHFFVLPGIHLGDNTINMNDLEKLWASDGYVWRYSESIEKPILSPMVYKAVYHDNGSITFEPVQSKVVYDLAFDPKSIAVEGIIPLTFKIGDKRITTPLAIQLDSKKESYQLLYRRPFLGVNNEILGFTWGFDDMNSSSNILTTTSTKDEILANNFTFLRAVQKYGLSNSDLYTIVGPEPTTEALSVYPANLRVIKDDQGIFHIQILGQLDILVHPNLEISAPSSLKDATPSYAFASKTEMIGNSGRPSAVGRQRVRAQQTVMLAQSRAYQRK